MYLRVSAGDKGGVTNEARRRAGGVRLKKEGEGKGEEEKEREDVQSLPPA